MIVDFDKLNLFIPTTFDKNNTKLMRRQLNNTDLTV